jgi:hypothetical protein
MHPHAVTQTMNIITQIYQQIHNVYLLKTLSKFKISLNKYLVNLLILINLKKLKKT